MDEYARKYACTFSDLQVRFPALIFVKTILVDQHLGKDQNEII